MFYYLYEWWSTCSQQAKDLLSPLRILQYITVRAFCGAGTAFLLTVVFGPWVIRHFRRHGIVQVVRKEEAPSLGELHGHKDGTPTMGGILVVSAIVLSCFLWAIPNNRFVWLASLAMIYMAAVGVWDDHLKVSKRESRGLRPRIKLLLEVLFCVAITINLLGHWDTHGNALKLMVPFHKDPVVWRMAAIAAFLFIMVIVVGATNAVNLTDGLDGLAVGCSGSAALAYLVMAYVAGHAGFSGHLLVPYVAGAGELAVFCGCMLGACLGFLWHNCHPASIFMGDTGSLALGGAIAMVAILIKQELVLMIVGGVFVLEAGAVIVQVVSYKLTGKRVFAMAPLHHHFEMKKNKWSETQVTVRFWILSIIFALLGVLVLKIR